jgi:2-phospho-L-lactate guanylyltransferase
VLVPVKAFGLAKRRLADVVDTDGRAALAQRLATIVVRAAGPLTVAVVCDDERVAEWARGLGALVLHEPGRGLNAAVEAGIGELHSLGATRVVVAHADLPHASSLHLVDRGGVTLVPDLRRDGTNIAVVPSDGRFRFSYGPGSFARHCAEAERIGLDLHIVDDARLGLDIDLPADLATWLGE